MEAQSSYGQRNWSLGLDEGVFDVLLGKDIKEEICRTPCFCLEH